MDALDEPLPEGIDLAVIGSLVDDVTVETDGAGSVVRMAWPVVPDGVQTAGSAQPALGTTPPSA